MPRNHHITSICTSCAKEFHPWSGNRGKFCSRKCVAISRTRTIGERFWEKVNKSAPVSSHAPHLGKCWYWIGTHHSTGYGMFYARPGQRARAHRFAYEMENGEIPKGLVIDHLCRIRHCVRPCHLEVVTHRTNILRGVSNSARNATKDRCFRGHPFSPDNTYIGSNGQRICKTCRREWTREYRRRKCHK